VPPNPGWAKVQLAIFCRPVIRLLCWATQNGPKAFPGLFNALRRPWYVLGTADLARTTVQIEKPASPIGGVPEELEALCAAANAAFSDIKTSDSERLSEINGDWSRN
jgi:hypothetical protein